MPDLIRGLERDIQQYDKVVLLTKGVERFMESGVLDSTESGKRFLFLLTQEDEGLLKNRYENVSVRSISQEESEEISRLYYTYEFTDNFLMLTENNPAVPSIFNFVESGILTEKEAWQALLL